MSVKLSNCSHDRMSSERTANANHVIAHAVDDAGAVDVVLNLRRELHLIR